MAQTITLHSPTLDSIRMVESTIKTNSQDGKYQIWKKLPKKMMYQTYLVILEYLIESGKILVEKDGSVIWTWDPEGVRKLVREGLMVR